MANVELIKEMVLDNINTGCEKSVNDSIFFGVGNDIYMYSDVAVLIGFAGLVRKNNAFTTVPVDLLEGALIALEAYDGGLWIN